MMKRVTVRCATDTVLELRWDISKMFGYLDNTSIRLSDKKRFTLALPETGNQYFYVYTDVIKSQLTTGLEVLRDVAKGENVKTAANKRND